MPPKKLKSQYHGTCRKCKQKYHPGDPILWYGKEGTEHEVCPAKVGVDVSRGGGVTVRVIGTGPKGLSVTVEKPKTLRDEFAMGAMSALLHGVESPAYAVVAEFAYKQADAMMAERAKPTPRS